MMTLSRLIRIAIAALGYGGMALACSSTGAPPPSVTGISVSFGSPVAKSAALSVGDSISLATVASFGAGTGAPPHAVTYVARDPSVVDVTSRGVVVGRSDGETWVVASLIDHGQTYCDSVSVSVGAVAALFSRRP